jgi:hypothetical protein
MYIDHPELKKPNNENAKIWRYMDLWKFLDMLATSSLHFSRVDCLDDSLEGTWGPSGVFEAYKSQGDNFLNQLKYWEKVFKTTGAVSCWNLNEDESEKMWKLYVKSDDGIVIQSTFGDFKKVMQNCERVLYIGLMEYIEYQSDKFAGATNHTFGNFTTFFNYKDKDFRHENELRALIMAIGNQGNPAKPIPEQGIKIPINLSELIKEIRISPGSETWKLDLVKKVVSDYEVETKVMPSSLV